MPSNFTFNAGGGITTADVTGGDKVTTTTTLELNLEALKSFASEEEVKQVQTAQSDSEQLAEVLAGMVTKYGKAAVKWMLGV